MSSLRRVEEGARLTRTEGRLTTGDSNDFEALRVQCFNLQGSFFRNWVKEISQGRRANSQRLTKKDP